MLFYYIIIILILSSGIAMYLSSTYAYKIYDAIYGIPKNSSFDYQNCQIDRSCWVPYTEVVPGMPALRSPYIGVNHVYLQSNYQSIPLPEMYYKRYTNILS
jgi:hypothetical protein